MLGAVVALCASAGADPPDTVVMPSVFISHAHSDRMLARSLCSLLRDALALGPDDFFTSSEEGRGVAPAANIQQGVLSALATAPCLIVLLTPKSALSRWVWLEAGNRLGQVDRANPLFVCPSDRFTSLLGPLGDKKSLNLDNEDELVELVQAVGKILGRTPRDYLSYKPPLADLSAASKREYSVGRERRDRLVAAVKRHWLPVVLTPLMLVAGYWYRNNAIESAQAALDSRDVQRNQDVAALAARYFILTGTVVAQKSSQAVADALVMASRDPEVRDRAGCQEPRCTFWTTDTDGKFSLDLTKIRAVKDELITLVVIKPGFVPNTKLLQIDVRAMDSTVAPQSVRLAMPMEPAPGTSP